MALFFLLFTEPLINYLPYIFLLNPGGIGRAVLSLPCNGFLPLKLAGGFGFTAGLTARTLGVLAPPGARCVVKALLGVLLVRCVGGLTGGFLPILGIIILLIIRLNVFTNP